MNLRAEILEAYQPVFDIGSRGSKQPLDDLVQDYATKNGLKIEIRKEFYDDEKCWLWEAKLYDTDGLVAELSSSRIIRSESNESIHNCLMDTLRIWEDDKAEIRGIEYLLDGTILYDEIMDEKDLKTKHDSEMKETEVNTIEM